MASQDYRTSTTLPDYGLKITNNSKDYLNFVVHDGATWEGGEARLAWYVKRLAPGTNGYIRWNETHELTWAECDDLDPGVRVRPSQTTPVMEHDGVNSALFTRVTGPYEFQDVRREPGGQDGFLIRCDDTIPAFGTAVGLALSGHPLWATRGQPDEGIRFTRSDRSAMAVSFMEGEVMRDQILDPAELGATSVEVVFPKGMFVAVAELSAERTWTLRHRSSLV